MTTQEFSNEFDVLYNNIMSNQAPGLDEFEKSVFLTKALDEILKSYFNPRLNKSLEGFDGNQRRQIDFSMLTKVYKVGSSELTNSAIFDPKANSRAVKIPSDILMIVNERATVTRNLGGNTRVTFLTVVPLLYDEYAKLMSKPFKRPLHYLAWRLINNSADNYCDLIVGPSDILSEYSIRYIKRPNPIILIALEGGLSILGRSSITECELDPILHLEILQRAVELAKAAYIGDLNSTIALGLTSETEKGIITQSR